MSARKTLLLSTTYEMIGFISIRKMIKLLFAVNKDTGKDKVEVISTWDDEVITWGSGSVKYPAILRLTHHVKRNFFNLSFSRKALVKRDRGICQYCNRKLTASQITVDHIIPRAQGGITSFTNCVVSCHPCNNKKDCRTPEQAGMKLARKPTHPSFSMHQSVDNQQEMWHDTWDDFLRSS